MAYAYAMLTEQIGKARFVKFGYATDLDGRLSSVQTGCPLRITTLLHVHCGGVPQAAALERALHREFLPIRSSGEWFKWVLGAAAEPEAREAMLLIGQRELGNVQVIRREIAPVLRALVSGAHVSSLPVIGDVDPKTVAIRFKRRKLLIENA